MSSFIDGATKVILSFRGYAGEFISSIYPFLEIAALVISGLLFWGIIYTVSKSGYISTRIEYYMDYLGIGDISRRRQLKAWKQIVERMKTPDASNWKLAILEADKVLDEMWKIAGYRGETVDERFKQVPPETISNHAEIQQAHRVRNRVVQEPDFVIAHNEVLDVLKIYKKAFQELKARELEINRFFIDLPPGCEDDFFNNGGFPFIVGLHNQVEISERIKDVINSIISKDIIALKEFKTETIGKIYDLLYLLANSDLISYDKLQKALRIDNIRTLSALLEVLVMSGILLRIKSYGQTYGATRKTPKYFFITPSLRSAILDNNFPSGIEGKKLEDYFALIMHKDLKKTLAVDLRYDFAEGGADFILTLKDRSNIVIEVGFNKKETEQVKNTMKKVKSRYGIVFGSGKLGLVEDAIVKIPLKYLLLI